MIRHSQIICLYIFIFLLLIVSLYIILHILKLKQYNWTIYKKIIDASEPPKPYNFIIFNKMSALDQILVTVAAAVGCPPIISTIVQCSAYLFALGLFLSRFENNVSSVIIPDLIEHLEHLIENSQRIHSLASAYLQQPGLGHNNLLQLHQYLTPYIISQESIWYNLLVRLVNHLERIDSPYFDQVDVLFENLRGAGNDLLELYRNLEGSLNISIQDSPVPSLGVEN